MSDGAVSKSRNPDKARRAARDPGRPGEDCKAAPGDFAPIVDRSSCEGKGDCVEVCPYDVFEVRRIADDEYRELGFFARLKVRAHGMKTSYTVRADACRACGLCVVSCPEHAVALLKR